MACSGYSALHGVNPNLKKILSALKLPSCGIVVSIDMNMYILTESRNFKTLLKENYAIALDSCYLFTKKMLNMELNMILIVVECA